MEVYTAQTILVTRITSLLVLVFSWNLSKNKKNIECDQTDPLISSDQVLFSSKSKDPVWRLGSLCTWKNKKLKKPVVCLVRIKAVLMALMLLTLRDESFSINWFLQHFFFLRGWLSSEPAQRILWLFLTAAEPSILYEKRWREGVMGWG